MARIKLCFFGSFEDLPGAKSLEYMEVPDTQTLQESLQQQFPDFAKIKYRVAVNCKIINSNEQLKDEDEVAFLPPFAGG